jgi:class 3 adenylate cyclase
MNLILRIVDTGTQVSQEHADVVRDRHIRFANAVSLIVCGYIAQCAALAVYHHQARLMPIYALHFAGIAAVPWLNHQGRPVLASAWFAGVAITLVSLYSVLFGVDSLNFTFLPMIGLLLCFFFSAAERGAIAALTGVTVIAFIAVLAADRVELAAVGPIPDALIAAQRFNSLVGLMGLSVALGAFALVTIARADHDVAVERDNTERLLHNILPRAVATELKATGRAEPRQFDAVTVLFTDFKGFTSIAETLAPAALLDELNTCFAAFDRIVAARGIEKIKTIGDAYLCAGGLPDPATSTAADVVLAALEMQAFMAARKEERQRRAEPCFEMRVGIHTGPVVAGIVGERKFAYDIWGDTVNTASRMKSSGEVGEVNVSEGTYEAVMQRIAAETAATPLRFVPRGKVQAKGKGAMEMYFVRRT